MTNLVPLIDWEKDIWLIKSNDDLSDYNFHFDFLPNQWFKEEVKRVTKETFIIGRLKISTLYRYNYSLKIFFKFLKESDIELNTFKNLDFNIVQNFLHYLLANIQSPATRSIALTALKHHVKHGQFFEWDGFPQEEVFDGTELRTLQSEDSLKSKLFDDFVINAIDSALIKMKSSLINFDEITLWSLITIVRHTGIRLTEALSLNQNCLRKDLMKKHLLEVVSPKNESERFIPVQKEVATAINLLIKATENIREELNSEKLFFFYHSKTFNYIPLKQTIARYWLKEKFVKRFDIREINGELATITYHQFRHQIGTDLLNNGLNIFEVMQYLGHESAHSTRLYAKVRNDKLAKEYKKLGFIGIIETNTDNIKNKDGEAISEERRLMAQLPDGVCAKPLNTKVINCKKPNACLFCPKFITTPDFLETHKDHLQRIKADKSRYLTEDLLGSDYLLNETEKVLEEIVIKLEKLKEKEEN